LTAAANFSRKENGGSFETSHFNFQRAAQRFQIAEPRSPTVNRARLSHSASLGASIANGSLFT